MISRAQKPQARLTLLLPLLEWVFIKISWGNLVTEKHTIDDLLIIMAKLRDPETGCPWDIKQNFESIAPYTIEEAYEVDDAIRAGDMSALIDELGDLLLQVVFHGQIAKDNGLFSFEDIVNAISKKMIKRHPHVFSGTSIEGADAQTASWEKQKAEERAAKATTSGSVPSALDGVTSALPALSRAVKLQKRAARVGFDWPEPEMVLDKIQEETEELLFEVRNGNSVESVKEEFGDLLFVLVNLGRHFKLDSEECLREANAKFERRFKSVERLLASKGLTPELSNLEEMDALWNTVKKAEKKQTV